MIGTVNDNKKHVNGLKTNANLGNKKQTMSVRFSVPAAV
jgi:hypothetical protein